MTVPGENANEAPMRVLGMDHLQAEKEALMFLARIGILNKEDVIQRCFPWEISCVPPLIVLVLTRQAMPFDEPTALPRRLQERACRLNGNGFCERK